MIQALDGLSIEVFAGHPSPEVMNLIANALLKAGCEASVANLGVIGSANASLTFEEIVRELVDADVGATISDAV